MSKKDVVYITKKEVENILKKQKLIDEQVGLSADDEKVKLCQELLFRMEDDKDNES